MAIYIFNAKAIGIAKETAHGAYDRSYIWTVEAEDVDEALERAEVHFETNKQFRFEYEYAGKE